MYLTKAQPVPINASVMKRRAPLSLGGINVHNVNTEMLNGFEPLTRTELYSQVCDIIHDSPAFDGMPLEADEVVVDLKQKERIWIIWEHMVTKKPNTKRLWTHAVENQ